MKAAWSIGANRPDDLRSAETTSEISLAVAGSSEPSAEKSVMAIGSGWIVPCVMLSSTTALAGLGAKSSAKAATAGRSVREAIERFKGVVMAILAAAVHLAWVEIEDEVAPDRVFVGRKRGIRLALIHGAHRAIGGGLEEA